MFEAMSTPNKVNVYVVDSFGRTLSPSPMEVGSAGKNLTLKLNPNTTYYIKVVPCNSYYYNADYSFRITRTPISGGGSQVTQSSTVKSSQSIYAYDVTKKISYKKVKKKAQSFNIIASAKTPVTFAKVSGSSKVKIDSNGRVTVKKKTKKGTYKVIVRITAYESKSYKAATKNIILTIKVK